MAGYTNRKDEYTEVSEDHIETAIRLKIELSKESSSGKISWAKHRRMMRQEGFDDSENSENYRQLIKREQKKRGLLSNSTTYAEMVSTKKLESVKEAVGELSLRKREAQLTFNELNKMKRQWSKDILLIEAFEEVLKNKDFSKPPEFNPVVDNTKTKRKMVACISDIHYGATVDVEGRTYNTEIAKEYLWKYASKIEDEAVKNNVDEIYLMNLGDTIEHLSMRSENYYSAEKILSEQVTEVSQLIIDILAHLSSKFKIKYSAIAGNHDRISGNKNDNVYSDSITVMSNKMIEVYVKYSNNPNVEFIEAEPYHHIISLENRTFLFVHGDKHSMKKETTLAEQSMIYGINFDAIFAGHIHNFTVKEVGEDRYVVTFGSIKGTDEYSLKTIGSTASRSQGIILVDEQNNYEFKQIKL